MKGPPKFSTLPRNFSLPGHGARLTPKEKESTWSGTSTLGPKPKSRVTEVQQIFDFRASEGTSSQSSRGTTSQGTGYVSAKPRDEVGAVARGIEEKTVGIQSRPNLLRASSMPITLQQQKGSDSSSPDRTLGTPENGSTENVFRASPDIVERRCLPQDRAGLHQQITVALKRVRELEEQVKTIPDLKSQICSLREEREQLLVQLQTQVQAQISPTTISPSSDAGKHTQPPGHKPMERLNLALKTHPTGGLHVPEDVEVTAKEKGDGTEKNRLQKETDSYLAHGGQGLLSESERQTQPLGQSDKQNETLENLPGHEVKKPQQNTTEQDLKAVQETETRNIQDGVATNGEKLEDQKIEQMLQEKLIILEAKLTEATHELEMTNVLLKEQIEDNKVKEEKILQLSEGMRVEVCTTEPHDRLRRESIDTGTETERIDLTHQETETELPGTVDQGTDTDRICIEVCVPKPGTGSIHHETKVEIRDQPTEMEGAAVSPPRPRANSMERGTVTERIATQDQTTETPVAARVNQVTETEGEAVTDHPQRPRASSADRGTETERVGTVDRVTETEVARRTDQQTETEMERRHENNPTRDLGAESQVRESVSNNGEDVDTVVSESAEDKEANERFKKDSNSVVMEVLSSVAAVESIVEQTSVSNTVGQNEGQTSPIAATGENKEFLISASAQSDLETKETMPLKNVVTETIETKQTAQETVEKKEVAEGKTVCATIKDTAVTDMVVIVSEDAAVKTVAPVRPQRGRKPSAEQAQPSVPQLQAAPVRPRRGSSETQVKQPQTKPQAQTQIQNASPVGQQKKHETPSVSQAEDRTKSKKPTGDSSEKKSPSQPPVETQGPSPVSSEAQTRPKSIKATQKGSSVSQTPTRGIGETRSRPTRQVSSDVQTQSQGSRRSSSESQPPQKDASETQSLRRGSSEIGQRRGSNEAQASRRDSSETQLPRRGSSESPTSPAALGQVVTRLTGLLGEQWAQLGSSSGTQQTVSQQESSTTQKQVAGKRPEAGKGATAKSAGKAAPAATTGKPAGKPGPSKMSSIQSQLVSSLSVLSAFYSPGQKTAASSKQQEQGRNP